MTEIPPRNARHTLKVLMRNTGRWVKKISEISARRRYFYCFHEGEMSCSSPSHLFGRAL